MDAANPGPDAVTDPTELAAAARRAAESREWQDRLAAVYAVAPFGIAEIDGDGVLVRANSQFCRLIGRPSDTLTDTLAGVRYRDLLHPDDATDDAADLVRLLNGEVGSCERTVRYAHADGNTVWADTTCTLAGNGPHRTTVLVAQDATARRLAEEALRASYRRISDNERRQDEFLAVLGHELRNPLGAIRCALDVLRTGQNPESAAWATDVSVRQIEHLARMTDDLLDVSRLGCGKIRLQTARIDLAALVRDTAAAAAPAFVSAGVALLVAPASPTWVRGDKARLAQAISHLLVNARKFTDAGGRVTVAVACEDGQAVVRVRDTGVGIAPATLSRLFTPFAQEDRSLDRSRGGLGLGLALVRGIAELHAGGASANSAGAGHGSEFSVWLPLAGASPPNQSQPLRVLVIEDNTDAADTMAAVIRLYGHEVCTASTGPAGVEAAIAWRPDAVLSDLGLPGCDGFAVARSIRAVPALASAYLVAISGYGREEDKQAAIQAGFDRHVTKPASPTDVADILEAARGRESRKN